MACRSSCACLGEPFECACLVDPVRFGHFAAYCAGNNANDRRHVLARSRMLVGEPPPEPGGYPTVPTPVIPFAGDLVAAMTAKLGADRFVKFIEQKTGIPCGCAGRRELLNRLDQKMRKFLGWA